MILAIGLSMAVILGWQYFFVGMPQMEKQKQEAQAAAAADADAVRRRARTPQQPGGAPQPQGGAAGAGAPVLTREAVLAASPRVSHRDAALKGSISLKGGRIDDLSLIKYRETVDPKSPPIVLLSPSGSPHPFYAEFGWVAAAAPT